MIQRKRIYDPPAKSDGCRILVDRIWPRGISKEKADLDEWLKEVAPTTELRKWYNHEEDKFPEFQKKYIAELKKNPTVDTLRKIVAKNKKVTLLFSAKSPLNQAMVLQNFLEK